MPSASNNNQSSTKLVKQTSVNSVNSGGPSGASGSNKGNKKITENTTKSNNANAINTTNTTNTNIANNETSSSGSGSSNIKTAKENTNNVVATAAAGAGSTVSPSVSVTVNSKNWETSSAAGNNPSLTAANKDAGNDSLNPMKLTFTTIEHKIRNLEKRKVSTCVLLCVCLNEYMRIMERMSFRSKIVTIFFPLEEKNIEKSDFKTR